MTALEQAVARVRDALAEHDMKCDSDVSADFEVILAALPTAEEREAMRSGWFHARMRGDYDTAVVLDKYLARTGGAT